VPSLLASKTRTGVALAVFAYAFWGFFPLYALLMRPTGAVELIAHRIIWALLVCLVALAAAGQWRVFTGLLRPGKRLAWLAGSSALLTVNWLVFLYATLSGHVIDSALGYFINPLVSVALGVLLLGERLRPAQWAAVGLAGLGVAAIWIGLGQFPWIALVVAFSFGFYGLMEKRIGRDVPALAALAVETVVMTPVAAAYLAFVGVSGASTFVGYGAWHALAVVGIGLATVIPLTAFNGAARRLPLSQLGLISFLGPVLQFLVGVLLLHEPMGTGRWIGFGTVWLGLVVVTADAARLPRRTAVRQPDPA
jgi:chloramphenicol-sensitive protein RarD